MTEDIVEIDRLILDVLVGKSTQWPVKQNHPDYELNVINRVLGHGLAGLLNKSSMALSHWPSSVIDIIYGEALAQVMWELRHKDVLVNLLKVFNDQDIRAIILKGTAIAYDLYAQPAVRQRGDTDILISECDLEKVQSILSRLGFVPNLSLDEANPFSMQENWDFNAVDGSYHIIDLHWSVMNAPHLDDLFTYDEALQHVRHLPRLSEYAQSFSLVYSLLFSCVHRAKHLIDPVSSHEKLIWAYDIDLYANALLPSEWNAFCALAHEKGIARICLDGLQYAARTMGTQFPEAVSKSLMAAPIETNVWLYLNEPNKFKRAFMDLIAIPGLKNKLRIIFKKVFPSAAFMRYKYKNMNHRSLLALHYIRFVEFISSLKK